MRRTKSVTFRSGLAFFACRAACFCANLTCVSTSEYHRAGAISTLGSDGGEVLVLALLRKTRPLDVGEALLLAVGGAPRLHDLLRVGRRRGGGGAAHGGCPTRTRRFAEARTVLSSDAERPCGSAQRPLSCCRESADFGVS